MATSETKALAIVASSLRRKTRPYDLVTVAEAVQHLVKIHGQARVANLAGVSQEMLRKFLSVLDLPIQVRKLVRARKLDHVTPLSLIARLHSPEKQKVLARLLLAQALTKDEVQDVVQIANRNRGQSIETSIARVVGSRPKKDRVYVIVAPVKKTALKTAAAVGRELRKHGAQQVHQTEKFWIVISDEKGYAALGDLARSRKVSLGDLPSALIREARP